MFLVLIACVVLMIVAIINLHQGSAWMAFIFIVVAGFAILRRGIKLRLKLVGVTAGLLIVLAANGLEGWQEGKSQEKAEEQTKQQEAKQAVTEAEQKRSQDLAFAQLSPKEHLDKARALLTVERAGKQVFDAPQSSIDEALEHLNAIKPSSSEFAKAQLLRQQFEAAQKRRDEENARIQVAEAKKHTAEEASLNRTLRDGMAKTLEDNLLDEGYNVDVRAIGNDHTTLHIKWILVSKALAHQLSNQGDFFRNARSVGFKRVEITDGYDETWFWKL